MSIVDGTGLITWEGGLFEPNSDLLRRVSWAFAQIRADGGDIELNEAGRPFGVAGDANVRNAWQTASHLSTVWFQWGRYLRGETPSAADPRSGNVFASEHTRGIAIDCNAKDVYTATLRAKYFHMVGMQQTISSESWHWAIRSNPTVDLSSVAGGNATPINNQQGPDKPAPEPFREEDMPYILASEAGQTFVSGDHFVTFQDGEVQVTAAPACPIVNVTKRVHNALLTALSQKTALPVVVNVTGDKTIYTLAGDRLIGLAAGASVQSLLNAGAAQITIDPRDRDHLLGK